MSWRADRAYEDAQRESFRKWKAVLTLREYLGWEMQRHGPLLTGAVATAFIMRLLMA